MASWDVGVLVSGFGVSRVPVSHVFGCFTRRAVVVPTVAQSPAPALIPDDILSSECEPLMGGSSQKDPAG